MEVRLLSPFGPMPLPAREGCLVLAAVDDLAPARSPRSPGFRSHQCHALAAVARLEGQKEWARRMAVFQYLQYGIIRAKRTIRLRSLLAKLSPDPLA
jgi:hypothetical protein